MSQAILSLEGRGDGVAVLWMNDPDESVNTLKRELIDEFDQTLEKIEKDREIKILVFASAKPEGFIAGANLQMLLDINTAEDAQALSEMSQKIHSRIERLKPVSVAAIHGPCLGGGLELALAFDSRIASFHSKTRLGLPEVQLGLLPGGGGTQRLPALIGIEKALDMLLTGRTVNAKRAYRMSLVDEIVHPDILIDAAIHKGHELLNSRSKSFMEKLKHSLSINNIKQWVLTANPLGRNFVFNQAHKRTLSKTRGNYPAPEKILEVVKVGLEQDIDQGEFEESKAFGELVVTPQARQLIQLFFSTTELKKDPGVNNKRVRTRDISKIGVLGAGLMGAGIAYVSLDRAQIPVRLKDVRDESLGRGIRYVKRLLDKRVERRSITPLQRSQIMGRMTSSLDYSGFKNCNLVIEAVFEDLELKQKMVQEVERHCNDDTIFATNTSALPVTEIAKPSSRPEMVIGMHYFSPVEKMPLLEIVITKKTAPWVISSCVEVGKKQGKNVIVVQDGPGFYTSRILAPYINEAAYMLSEGIPIDQIDRALMDFGYPIGPMALLDEVGIDVGYKVAHTLGQAFGERMQSAEGMAKLIGDGRLGKKNGRGLYVYDSKHKKDRPVDESVYQLLSVMPKESVSNQEIIDRCALQMINEAAYCLGEGIVRSPRDADIGAVLGLGFPPFRGGPFRYLDSIGINTIIDQLNIFADRYGQRFIPAPILTEQAKSNEPFYS